MMFVIKHFQASKHCAFFLSIMGIKHHKIHGMENIEHYSGTYIREVLNSSPADLNATLHIDVNPLRKAGHVLT